MATISWGKCNLAIAMYGQSSQTGDIADASCFVEIATPVNGSTTVNVDEGEKHEAEIEGGGNEAVRYDDDKVSVEFDVRRAAGRPTIGTGTKRMGQVPGEWALAVQPEDPNAEGFLVERGSIKRGISFTSSDGIYDHYTMDALVPEKGDALKVGYVGVSEWKADSKNGKVDEAKLGTTMTSGQGTKWKVEFQEDDTYISFT